MTTRYIEVLNEAQMLATLKVLGLGDIVADIRNQAGVKTGERLNITTKHAAVAYFPNHAVKAAVVEQTGTDKDGNPTFRTVTPAVRKNVLMIRDRSPDGAFETKFAEKVGAIEPSGS
jgi:hypothetical protein